MARLCCAFRTGKFRNLHIPDSGPSRSIGQYGLEPDLRCTAANWCTVLHSNVRWQGGWDRQLGNSIVHTPKLPAIRPERYAWNEGCLVHRKRPWMPKYVWATRVRLEIAENHRDLALFNIAIDGKLRGCDLVRLQVAESLRQAWSQNELLCCNSIHKSRSSSN